MLNIATIVDAIEPHEIRFYERMTIAWQQKVSLVPIPPRINGIRLKSADFVWHDHGNLIIELRGTWSTRPVWKRIRKKILDKARGGRAQGVTLENFVIDLGDMALSAHIRESLMKFNQNVPGHYVSHIWVASPAGLEEIVVLDER
ncbi:MAG: hypothetical protein LBH13_08740 [Cellulomonadaceae bacterium]|nr:hypothetical protein [Cellulomonadaceae bacterium]